MGSRNATPSVNVKRSLYATFLFYICTHTEHQLPQKTPCRHAPTLSMLGECPDTHIACRLFNSFCFYSSTAIILYECAWASKSPGIEYPAPFDRPFYLLINLAVGSTFD